MRKLCFLLMLLLCPLTAPATETLYLSGSDEPDLLVYAMNTAPPELTDTTATASPFDVLCALWYDGRVVIGNESNAEVPSWQVQLSPHVAEKLINDCISSATKATSAEWPHPLKQIIISWQNPPPLTHSNNVRGSYYEYSKLRQAPSDPSVSPQAKHMYTIIQNLLEQLPPPESGTRRAVIWTYQ